MFKEVIYETKITFCFSISGHGADYDAGVCYGGYVSGGGVPRVQM